MNPAPDLDRHVATIRSGAWFRAAPLALQNDLLAAARVRRLEAGELLFAKGDPPDGVYAIAQGGMRFTSVTASGKEALLAVIEPPYWFGEIALFDGQARTHDAWAALPSALLHVPQAALTRMLAAQPVYWHTFGLLLTQKLRGSFVAMEEYALLPPAGRLARRLAAMAEGFGEPNGHTRRAIRLRQEQLALMLSLSRQTVNQLLKRLEAQGAVRLERGCIEILNLQQLRHWVE